jgi:hypothetical protein
MIKKVIIRDNLTSIDDESKSVFNPLGLFCSLLGLQIDELQAKSRLNLI